MKHKTQTRWAIVHHNGQINHGHMAYSRKNAIASIVKQYRGFGTMEAFAGLSDSAFWQKIKRKYGHSARRVHLKVVR